MTNEEVADDAPSTSVHVPISIEAQPPEIVEIFDFLANHDKVVFKSQQIDDPELTMDEKRRIALKIYIKDPENFLCRFGFFLQETHLNNFLKLACEDDEELSDIAGEMLKKLKTNGQLVKNRRYAALNNLIDKGEYFSETEMMKREPKLYFELVGQYLTDEEKKKRDSYDLKNTSLSGILLHTFEQRERNDLMEKTKAELASDSEDDGEEDEKVKLPNYIKPIQIDEINESISTESFGQQWGNFDDEQVPCSLSALRAIKRTHKKIKSPIEKNRRKKFITSGERDMLRQEFVEIMHTKFLSGSDKEFDYRQVDENADFDDLKQLNQDIEDEYFNDSEDSNDKKIVMEDDSEDDLDESNDKEQIEDDSEDELDVYMEHLSKHLKSSITYIN